MYTFAVAEIPVQGAITSYAWLENCASTLLGHATLFCPTRTIRYQPLASSVSPPCHTLKHPVIWCISLSSLISDQPIYVSYTLTDQSQPSASKFAPRTGWLPPQPLRARGWKTLEFTTTCPTMTCSGMNQLQLKKCAVFRVSGTLGTWYCLFRLVHQFDITCKHLLSLPSLQCSAEIRASCSLLYYLATEPLCSLCGIFREQNVSQILVVLHLLHLVQRIDKPDVHYCTNKRSISELLQVQKKTDISIRRSDHQASLVHQYRYLKDHGPQYQATNRTLLPDLLHCEYSRLLEPRVTSYPSQEEVITTVHLVDKGINFSYRYEYRTMQWRATRTDRKNQRNRKTYK